MLLKKTLIYSLLVLLVIFLHINLKRPKNNLDWSTEVSVQTIIEQEKDISSYQFKNIRDWSYDSDKIVSENYIERTYNPDNITDVWFLVEPFGSWDGVAHTYFTFDFSDNEPLSFSIEARKEVNEDYSPLHGLFREYELIYIWGTEEDFLIRRAVYLDNDVYMYPLKINQNWKKNLFIQLTEETKKLNNNPRFYNTLTTNCTNTLANIVNGIRPGTVPWHPSRLFTGYSDEYLSTLGYISKDKDKYFVSTKVKNIYKSDNFSTELRDLIKN